jgi:hypothetical protein
VVGREQPTLDEADLVMMRIIMAVRVVRAMGLIGGAVADGTGCGHTLRHWASLSNFW